MHRENTANQSLHDHCIVVKSIYILIMEILHGKQYLDCFFKSVLQVLSKEMYPMQQWSENLFKKDARTFVQTLLLYIVWIKCVQNIFSVVRRIHLNYASTLCTWFHLHAITSFLHDKPQIISIVHKLHSKLNATAAYVIMARCLVDKKNLTSV